MKKQLFSLMMAFALVLGLSVTASAQDGLTVGTAYWHIPGSSHGVAVDNHTGATYDWAITLSDCDGNASGAVEAGTSITTGSYEATITYSSNASGVYRTTCTESYGGCSTIRQFYTAVMNINVVVTSTLADGTTAAPVSDCNDYDERGPGAIDWFVPNVDTDDGGGTAAQLAAHINATTLYNTRWVNIQISVSSTTACPVGGAITAGDLAWQFDYTIEGSPATNTNYVDNFIGLQPVANVTYGDATAVANTITVAEGTTNITIPMRSNIRWGTDDTNADQSFTFAVAGVRVDDDGNNDFTDGGESTANAALNNVSAAQTIEASPATPRIIIND